MAEISQAYCPVPLNGEEYVNSRVPPLGENKAPQGESFQTEEYPGMYLDITSKGE